MPSPTPVEYRSKRDPATPGVGEALRVRSGCSGRRRPHPGRRSGRRSMTTARASPRSRSSRPERFSSAAARPFVAPLVVAAGAVVFTLVDPSVAYDTDTMFLPILSLRLGGRLARRPSPGGHCAGERFSLPAGRSSSARRTFAWTELIWLSFPLIGIFLISAARRKAFGAGSPRRGAGTAEQRRRRGEPSRTSGTGSPASCTTCSRTRSA